MADQWTKKGTIVTIQSRWVTLHAEQWVDQHGQQLEYWRVEKDHSLIVVALQGDQLLLPVAQFRPGVGYSTLDLPGGRLAPGMPIATAAAAILRRELGLAPEAILQLQPLNEQGWIVNSSFSNQLLFGVVAQIDPTAQADPALLLRTYDADPAGLRQLLAELECLQCRAVVQELISQWLLGI